MRVDTLISVVALMAIQGASAAPVAQDQNQEQHLDKRWCLLGFIGTSCGPSKAVTSSSAVSSAKASSTSVAPVSSSKASSASSASAAKITSSSAVAKAPTTTVTTAAASSTAAWSSCKEFDWSQWNNGWSWGGYSIDYVKAWYIDVYGLKPPPHMNWRQVSALVSQFGQKTVAAGPKATSAYHRGCSNPWTVISKPTSTGKVTTTAAASSAATSKAAITSASASASASASKSSAVAPVSSAAAASASKSSAPASASASASASKSSAAASTSAAVSVSASSSAAAAPAASSASVAAGPASSSASAVDAGPASSVAASASSAAASSAAAATSSAAAATSSAPVVDTPATSVVSDVASASAQSTDAATSVVGGTDGGVSNTAAGNNSAAGSNTATGAAPAATPAPVVINGYATGGCVQEVAGRLLSKVQTSSSSMTVQQCTSLCMSYGFGVAGLEYGNECYCGVVDDVDDVDVSGECYMPCAGDSSLTCGGPNALNIYVNEDLQPATVVLPAGWTTYGVVAEGTNGRALPYTLWNKQDNTIESCANGCAAAGFSVSGTEYSSECYCGNSFQNGGGAILDSAAAFMACSGNLAQMCGGPSILSVVTSLSGTIPSTA